MRRDELTALGGIAAAGAVLAPATALAWLASARARRDGEVGHALARLGVRAPVRSIAPLGGGRSNAVWRVDLDGHAVVLKRALPFGAVLALGARWAGPQPFAADVSAAARITREAWALRRLAAAGVPSPRVLAVDPAHGLLLMSHLRGEPLPRALTRAPGPWATAYAAAIAAAHAAGVVLTDGHAGNALALPDGRVALLDLEFAEPLTAVRDPDARRAFDVAYAARYLMAGERAAFVARFAAIDLRAADARLAPYARLFARERARQRRSP